MDTNGKLRRSQRQFMFVFPGGYESPHACGSRECKLDPFELKEERVNELRQQLISELRELGC